MVRGVLITTSYDEDINKAIKSARYWAATMLRFVFKYQIADPREIEEYAKLISDEQLLSSKLITSKPEDYIEKVVEMSKRGVNWILFINSSPDHEKFFKVFGEKVIPYFKER
jgi:ribosomal protein L10